MYEDGWKRFVKTGQISDYLAYKEHPTTENKAGEIRECRCAGFYHSNRNCHQSRTNR